MHEGRIVEYIDQGRFICALCIQDKGNRLHLLTSSNREVNLAVKRAFLISTTTINTMLPRDEQLVRLAEADEVRTRLKKEVRVEELWELIKDESESFDYKYLAQLCFGDVVSDNHVSALVRSLFEDGLYFRLKDARFLPNPEDRVLQIAKQRDEEIKKENTLRVGSAWLKEVLQNKIPEDPPCKGEVIRLLVELALYGLEAKDLKYTRELLAKAGVSDIQEARKLLVSLGVWQEDENLDLLRLDIRASFPQDLLREADRVAALAYDTEVVENLKDLPVLTIDGPLTKDFDDAISLEMVDGIFHLGIHIADVAYFIEPGSPLDGEASLRASSLYLPRHQIPMLPPALSQSALSLRQNSDRPAISLLSRFDKEGNLLDFRFVPSLIQVKEQLTYSQVDDLCVSDGRFQKMYSLSSIMRQKRIEQGALLLSLPEISIEVGEDSMISLSLISQDTPARMIVGEFMIFYNCMAARLCRDHGIPSLYRGQDEPSERLSFDGEDNIFSVFKQRRKLTPLVLHVEHRPHAGLGVDAYTQVSSPIRRYFDLVVQRQIRNFLLGRPPAYNKEALEEIRMSTMPVLKDLGKVRQTRIRYWIQKYLLQHKNTLFPALVLDVLKVKYRVLFVDFLIVGDMRREEGLNLAEGQKIMVKVAKCDPWNDVLVLHYAGGYKEEYSGS